MDTQSVIMFYELCRLCLENAGSVDMFDTEDLVKDIYTFIEIKVTLEDKLPQKICAKCSEVINNVKTLKSMATKNDSHLKSLFGDDDDEEVEYEQDPLSETSSIQIMNTRERIMFEDDDYDIINAKDKISRKSLPNDSTSTGTAENNHMFNGSSVVNISTRRCSAESILPNGNEKVYKRTKMKIDKNNLECKTCQKIFETPKKLYLHHRLHVKKIFCPLDACAKRFATKGDLVKHIRTHTGEKPYACDICAKSFTQKGTLRAHIEAVHESYTQKNRRKS